MKKKSKRIKKVGKEDLKKIKGGIDVVSEFMDKALKMQQDKGTHIAVDVGWGRAGIGLKIKW
ncbi:MAG: hypothetical protein WCQ47_06590 [bacterium]